MHFILVNFRLLIFGESTDACEYTVHVQCSPLICQYTKSWVDAGEAATVAPYAEVGRRRHQCGLQLWHNAKSSDDDIIIAARRRKRAERLFIFIFQSEPGINKSFYENQVIMIIKQWGGGKKKASTLKLYSIQCLKPLQEHNLYP